VPVPGLSVVVPAFNEAARLPRTLTEMLGFLAPSGRDFEILVVDDGSADDTAGVIEEFAAIDARVRLIRFDRNHGKGFAVKAGVAQARGDQVLYADADGSTPFGEIAKLERALAEGAEIAMGTRAARREAQQVRARWYRKFIGGIFNGLVAMLVIKGHSDTQCGFKLLRAPVANSLFPRLRLDGFAFDVELLAIARQDGVAVREVAIDWAHQPGSKINLLTDSLRMARDLLAIRWGLQVGVYVPRGAATAVIAPPRERDGSPRS